MADLSALGRFPKRYEIYRRSGPRKRHKVALRILAVRALRSLGFGSYCVGEPNDFANSGRLFSATIFLAALVGLLLWLMGPIGFSWWGALIILSGALVVMGTLSGCGLITPKFFFLLAVLSWVIVGLETLVTGHGLEQVLILLLPVVLVITLRWAARAAELTMRVPLFIPAALVIVIVPLLTRDPWLFAAEARWRLVFVGIFGIVPLFLLVVWRFRRLALDDVFDHALKAITDDVDRAVEEGTRMLRSRCLMLEDWPESKDLNRFLSQPWKSSSYRVQVQELQAITASTFRRKCIWRFFTLMAGTSIATFIIIYCLAVAAIPGALVIEWSKVHPTTFILRNIVPDYPLALPLWPYTGVAALFSILAAVGFLAYALTEEVYNNTLVDAIFGRIARLLLIIGVPFRFDGGRVEPATGAVQAEGRKERDGNGSKPQRNQPRRPPTRSKR